MIDFLIVILSYNTKELLRDCIRSIKKSELEGITYEIVVVDNASRDGSAEIVRKEFPDITLIANKENIGYSKGNNLGVQEAKGRYIVFLNADTLVYARTIKTMIRFMDEHQEAGAATCKVLLPNNNLDDSCHRGFPTPWNALYHFSGLSRIFPRSRIFAGYSLRFLDLDKTHEIDSCSGAFIIVRRQAGEEIGWWDEDFFWYGEDLDLCFRLKERGWKIYFVPTVKILHYKGVSGGIKSISQHLTRATKETRLRATRARFEAMKIFYKKHYVDKYPKIITWLVMQGINFKHRLSLRSLT